MSAHEQNIRFYFLNIRFYIFSTVNTERSRAAHLSAHLSTVGFAYSEHRVLI